jgi:hypothetical protein
MGFAFNPATGLRNTTTYPSKPVSGTAAREQIQGRLDEVRDYINKHGVTVDDTGIVNAMVVTLSPVPSANTDILLNVKVKVTNTGAATINVNSLGDVAIKKMGGTALVAGELVANSYATLMFDGVYFELLNPASVANPVYSASGTFEDTTTSILTTATFDLDIDIGILAKTGIIMLKQSNSGSRFATILSSNSENTSIGNGTDGTSPFMYDYLTLGYCTGSMYCAAGLYIRVIYAKITSTTLRIRFKNYDTSTRTLSVKGYYNVNL